MSPGNLGRADDAAAGAFGAGALQAGGARPDRVGAESGRAEGIGAEAGRADKIRIEPAKGDRDRAEPGGRTPGEAPAGVAPAAGRDGDRPVRSGYGTVARRPPCLLEIVSKLAREPWTDRPTCVHPTLASIGRVVHDFSSPAGRPALLPLAPGFIATARTGFETSARLVALCVSTALASPAQDRITPAERTRLTAAHQTALYLLSGRKAHGAAGAARWWLPVLDRVGLSEAYYRTFIAPEHAAEAVSVAARAADGGRDVRLRQLLKQCLATAGRASVD